ncbi:MAG TPA: putative S-layer protein [Candidatus Nanoarchaeia archaeon]|nr:putative S-layer protein [Candidatus Nanoarchaeia archaeon]
MKAKLPVFAILCVFLVVISVLASITQVSLTWPASGSKLQTEPGESVTYTVLVRNTGDELVGNIDVTITDLNYESYVISKPTTVIPRITNLAVGDDYPVSFTISVPSTAVAGSYKGQIIARYYYESGLASWTDEEDFYLDVVSSINPQSLLSFSKTKLEISSDSGETTNEEFAIKNDGNVILTNLVINHDFTTTELEDNDGENIILSISPTTIASLNPGESRTIDVNIDVDNNYDSEIIEGNIQVSATQITTSLNLPTTLRIQSGLCEAGQVGDLDISIDDPDDEDEFNPGEEILVKVNVENNADDDLNILIEAQLIEVDTGDVIDSEKSDDIEINDGNDEDFEVTLKVDEDIDEDNDYKIVVKAYEKGDEDINCASEEIDVDLTIPDHKLSVDRFELNPESVECGEKTQARIDIKNLGSNDEDFNLKLRNLDLNYDETTNNLDIEEMGQDDEYTESFIIDIPENTPTGDYVFDLTVEYEEDDLEDSVTLGVYCSLPEEETTEEETTEEGTANTIIDTQNPPLDEDEGTVTTYTSKGFFDDLELGTAAWIAIDLAVLLLVLLVVVWALKKGKKTKVNDEIEEDL